MTQVSTLDSGSTLAAVAAGVPFHVEAVTGPPTIRRRMAELGLRAGTIVTVLQRTAGGGRLLAVAGARIAVDAATAGRVLGQPLGQRTGGAPPNPEVTR